MSTSSIFGFVVSTFIAISSFASESGMPDLDCRYIYAIEQVYLSQHVKYSQRDSALQERVIDQYTKHLDPTKVYLTKPDVDQIKKLMGNILEKTKAKDCSPFAEIQKLLVARVKERAEFAKKMLGKDYKFDSKVEFVFDPQTKPYPATKEESEDFLKKYVHFQISNYLATDMKLEEAKTNVIKSWDRALKKITETKETDVLSGYLDAFANGLDPHSSYFSRDSNEDFRIQMGLSLEGIGATLSSQDGFTVIEALVPGGPAARSGLVQPQDKIIAVGQGEKGSMENIIEMDLRDVVRKIRGPKGSTVRLLVLRKKGDGKTRVEVSIVRDKVKLEDDAASITYVDREIGGAKRKFAILTLPSFYADARRGGRSCAADMKKLIEEARQNKAEGIVLDLSNNGGGSLEDAVKIAGLFFATGNVVKQSSKDEGRGEITLKDQDSTVDWSGPLVVLTSRISASASEIVSGTLKDYKRAVIVGGDHTFGKGTVQTVVDIPPNSGALGAVKVTVGMFFTPGGFSTQHRGVEADIPLPGQYNQDDIGEKSLDYSLPPKQIPSFISPDAYVKEGASAWTVIQPDLLKSLAEKSKTRVEKNEEFKKIIDELNKSKQKGKLIKLSEASKDKEKKEKAKAVKSAGKAEKEKEYLKRADIQEALNVLGDLTSALGSKSIANK
ncbi:MAG: tail-specific protease [Oligoflexia bacterium]|nr:MAG: tail-specific protease [Oligoflexia bacterium]